MSRKGERIEALMRANIDCLTGAVIVAHDVDAKALEAELLGCILAELELVYDGIRPDEKVY